VLCFPLLLSFAPSALFSPVSIISPMLYTLFALTLLLSEGQVGEAWETLKQKNTLSSIEDRRTDKYFDVASGLKDR